MSNPIRDEWQSEDGAVRLILGDCLEVLPTLEPGSIDAVVTDPPYSSGGMFRGDRSVNTATKYSTTGTQRTHNLFAGDNRDQRAWMIWCSLWLGQTIQLCKPAAPLFSFTDWRQLPALSDVLQCGGWIWRGIIPWNKTESARPQRGWFRAQCEYVLTATAGGMTQEQKRDCDECLPGVWFQPVVGAEKQHQTEKPIELLEWLLTPVPVGATVLDPFAGSATTAAACIRTQRRFIGFEIDSTIYETAVRRVRTELERFPLFEKATARLKQKELSL